jgi:hypothetical protein
VAAGFLYSKYIKISWRSILNNAILPFPDKTPHNLSYIPKAMPDEFLGWYEYRFKKSTV